MTSPESRRFPQTEPTLAYDVAKARLAMRFAQIDSLDTKVATLLGFGSSLLVILGAFLALNEEPLSRASVALFIVAAAIYVLLAAASLYAYSPRKWEAGPKLDELWGYAEQYAPVVLGWWAAESFKTCCKNVEDQMTPKLLAARLGVFLIAIEASLLVAGLVVQADLVSPPW